MAKAYKCDLCGELYTINAHKIETEQYLEHKKVRFTVNISEANSIDICPFCHLKLLKINLSTIRKICNIPEEVKDD